MPKPPDTQQGQGHCVCPDCMLALWRQNPREALAVAARLRRGDAARGPVSR